LNAYRYLHLDVFTDVPFTGNPLAVFLDAAGLTAERMQRIAMEMAFPETTFVFAPESGGTNARVRIFTPAVELPIAGHPTIGTAFALAASGRVAAGAGLLTLGLGIGPVPVHLQWRDGRLSFAQMVQPLPQFGGILADTAAAAAA
jgi:trans-2,3-dihydro-3-hydroxyanthranilate isomerase